jgi:hypothetical protein
MAECTSHGIWHGLENAPPSSSGDESEALVRTSTACPVERDLERGLFINRNYSGYLVPTNADIPELDVLFVGGFDEEASPLGVKGLDELTAISVAPAIANAVYHATGKRVRDLPITIDDVM